MIVAGLISGVIGTGLVVAAIQADSLIGLLIGMVLMGMANSAVVMGRFAAAEVHPPNRRGRAISNVVIGGTIGSVFGPLLVGPTGVYMHSLGMDELAGAYAAGFILFSIAALTVYVGLRPDPRELGREVTALYPDPVINGGRTRPVLQILRQPAALLAVSAMVLGQVVMVGIMVITSLYMRDHQHELGDISLVISSHTFGMYAFSIISGRLVDRLGREKVILAGTSVLLLSCILAPLSPDVLPLSVALFLLGLGWNFCFVGGSTLLADQLSATERSRTQGINDLLVGLASALGSLGSGLVFAISSYQVVTVTGLVLSLLPLGLALNRVLKMRSQLPSGA